MNVKYFEIVAANKDCKVKFTDLAKVKYKKVPIFEHACNCANTSTGYKRAKRHLEILEIGDFFIRIKLTSESSLEMASKSLVVFSRELLRIDEEMNPDMDKRLFAYMSYRDSLFKYNEIDEQTLVNISEEMSDVDALKLCVELFCDTITTSKDAALTNANMKKEIKETLKKYATLKRLNGYNAKMTSK